MSSVIFFPFAEMGMEERKEIRKWEVQGPQIHMQLCVDRQPAGISGCTCAVGF